MPDEDTLVADLQRLAEELDRPPRSRDVRDHGQFSVAAYQSTFGSWADALEAAGFDANRSGTRYDDDELLTELDRLATDLGHPPTVEELRQHGSYSISPYRDRFGSWKNVLEAAGLEVTWPKSIPRKDLLAELRRLADDVGHTPTGQEMEERGRYSRTPYRRRFGSWTDAQVAAGLEPREPSPSLSDEELLEELRRVGRTHGSPPTQRTVDEQAAQSPATYTRRFGSWQAALEAAGFETVHPGGRAMSDEALLEEMHACAERLGHPPTFRDMNEHGEYSPTTYIRHFGSWADALQKAGFEAGPTPSHPLSDDRLCEELQRLAEELGAVPTSTQMSDRGKYHASTYIRRFGSWAEALEAADFDAPRPGRRYSDEELIEDLQQLADRLGHPPTARDMNDHGDHSASTYSDRFGSWADALEEAGFEVGPAPSHPLSDDRLCEELQRLAEELGAVPTTTQMNDRGQHDASTYIRRFGSWADALEAAGIE